MLTERSKQTPKRKSRLAAYARILYLVIPAITVIVILGIGQVISTNVANDSSRRLARQYSIEAAANFLISVNPHFVLMQQLSRSTTISRWLANADDPASRAMAFEEIMGYAVFAPEAYIMFTVYETWQGYNFTIDLTPEKFTSWGRLSGGEASQWFFDTRDAEMPFILNVQRTRPVDDIWELYIWSNHRMYYQGRIAGVVTVGSHFDGIFNATFGGFNVNHKRGYLIDRHGTVRTDSAMLLEVLDDGLATLPALPEAAYNPALYDSINKHLQRMVGGIFHIGAETLEAIPLSRGIYRYGSITPIIGTDWSVVVLSNHLGDFGTARYRPLIFAAIAVFIVSVLVGNTLVRRVVLIPLFNLTQSAAAAASITAKEDLFGLDRDDEIGDLSRTVQLMRDSLNSANVELEKKQHVIAESQEALKHREMLLNTVNHVAEILLTATRNDFESALQQSMKMIGCSLDADRVQMWRLNIDTSEFCITFGNQWLSDIGQQTQQPDFNKKISLGALPNLEERFLRNEYINGPAANLLPEEQRFLNPYGTLKSVVIIPVFLHEQIWGLFNIDSCVKERTLTIEEIDILRSATLMIASAYNRMELAIKEQEAQETLKHREELLNTLNRAAEILLTAEETDTMEALLKSMEIVGRCLDVDRVEIWRNEVIDGDLDFAVRYDWLSELGKGKMDGALGMRVPGNIRTRWLEMFLKGDCINGPISTLPPEEAAFLGYYEVVSTVILPLFLNEEFFGFLCIDDCRRERTFTGDEMDMLTSAGLMFTNVFNRNLQRDLAFTDALTGVRNRRYLMEAAEQELRNCNERNWDFSLIMIDIDHFKSVNDRYGHAIGDAVLKIFTARVSHALKHDTLLARSGGEEFVVTLPGVDLENAMKTAWRIQATLAAYAFWIEDLVEINVTASFGVASKTINCTTLPDIIDDADKALYQAKRAGRNTVIGYKSTAASP